LYYSLTFINVSGKLVMNRDIRNRRAEPKPPVLVVVSSIDKVARVLARRYWCGGKHNRAAIGIVNYISAQTYISTFKAVQEFEYSCAAVETGRTWSVKQATDSAW